MSNIDMVIAYVDNKDEVWRKTYIDYCQKNNLRIKIAELHSQRYECIGLVNWQLKLVEKNMPFVDTIYLLVSNKEQTPKNLSNKVKVVLHKDFIPQQFLPTFNSTTIEMFLWNIPNLKEQFIYANDDMLPTKPLKATDFFFQGKARIKFVTDDITKKEYNQFACQCWNSYVHVLAALHKPYDTKIYEKPIHSMTPMIRSHCKEIYYLLEKAINREIRAFRTDWQHNQYIYPIYEKYAYKVLKSEIDFHYTETKRDVDLDHQIVCINKICPQNEKLIVEGLNKLCE